DNLGENEQNACSSNPYDCWRSRNDAPVANAESVKYLASIDGSTTDNRIDAARHCIWQGLTTESSNAGFAQTIGDAHEKDGGDGTPPSHAMDIHNNGVGRNIGIRNERDRAAIINQCVTLARNAPIIPNPQLTDLSPYSGQLIIIKE
ncbi:MAG: DUF6973 domain-containing protein, partial [Mycobacteriaceae bacterium]